MHSFLLALANVLLLGKKNMHIKIALGRGSEGNEEHVIRDWRKGDLCYTAAESLAELCPAVICKAELVNDKLG